MRRVLLLLIGPLTLVAACSGQAATSPTSTPSIPPTTNSTAHPTTVAAADWPTYHHDAARTGATDQLAPLGTLASAWHAKLDGAVYGQPLVVGGQVLAATENDTVYSLDPASGKVNWQRNLGTPQPHEALPCGNISPLGITGTMVFDPATSRVFAVAETPGGAHTLYGLNVASGAVDVRVPVEPPLGKTIAHQQRGALTLFGGRVYVPYGALAGDCSDYIGTVVSVSTAGADVLKYTVPTAKGGGAWAPGGGVVDGDHLLFTAANGASGPGDPYDYANTVFALNPAMQRTDSFAPPDWAQNNAGDVGIGSSTPVLVGDYVVVGGKSGPIYSLRRDHLGGINGQVALVDVCPAFGGSAVSGSTVFLPCVDGTPQAITIGADGSITPKWKAHVTASGSPVVGGGVVWDVNYEDGVLYALDPATGAERAHLDIGTAPHFASPTLSGSHVYVGTMDGVAAAQIS